ncbi:MAG TPA: SIMPL domain-containing protein [Methylocella sp.]|nr:SIMPL domain-containing protein [Methylocella sp.]
MFAAAGLALFTWMQLNAARAEKALSPKDSVPIITTNGEASAEVVPDIATISLGVDTERPKAADAARENTRAAQAIVNEIKAQGVDAKDIKTISVTLAPVYDEERDANGFVTKRTLRGYIANDSLTVRVKDIGKAGTLASQMMDKGANRFNGITYEYSQKEEKIDSLRGDAVRDALRKANSYVKALGIRLGRVLEIASQPHASVPVAARMMAAAAPAREAAVSIPVEPGIETLRTEVQVTWNSPRISGYFRFAF